MTHLSSLLRGVARHQALSSAGRTVLQTVTAGSSQCGRTAPGYNPPQRASQEHRLHEYLQSNTELLSYLYQWYRGKGWDLGPVPHV